MINQSQVCYQIDSGSAATTVSTTAAVEDYQDYPLDKRPTLTSATAHCIQSQGVGDAVLPTAAGSTEKFRSKVTPGLKHDILSPGQHLDENREKYWGFMLLVDARSSSSRLIFKSNGSASPVAPSTSNMLPDFQVTSSDTIIDGVYHNRFQYTKPIPLAMMQDQAIQGSLLHRLDTNPSENQLVCRLTSDLRSTVPTPNVLHLRDFDDFEQISLLLINRLVDYKVATSLDPSLRDSLVLATHTSLARSLSQAIGEHIQSLPSVDLDYVPRRFKALNDDFHLPVNFLSAAVKRALWHIRGCHQSDARLDALQNVVDGIPKLPVSEELHKCVSCVVGKMRKNPRGPSKGPTATFPFQGLQMDPGFMFQKSKDSKRVIALQSHLGHNAYVNFWDDLTKVVCGETTEGKSPPLLWIHLFLTRVRPKTTNCWVRLDQGGETARHPGLRRLLTDHNYAIEQTGTGASSQIGGVERSHSSIGNSMCCMLFGANVPFRWWPFAFHEFQRLVNCYPAPGQSISKFEHATGKRPDFALHTAWGCHVYAQSTKRRSARLATKHIKKGMYMGKTSTDQNFYYVDLSSNILCSARHGRFDEFHYGLSDDSPNTRMLRERLGYIPDASLDDYKSPLAKLEILSDDSPFTKILEVEASVSCRDPALGFILGEDPRSRRNVIQDCQSHSTAATIPNWRDVLPGSTILSVNGAPVYRLEDTLRLLQEARDSNLAVVTLHVAPVPKATPEQVEQSLPQISSDQLRRITRHLSALDRHSPSPPVSHLSDTDFDEDLTDVELVHVLDGPSPAVNLAATSNRRKCQLRPDWSKFKEAEHKQLNVHFEMGVYGEPVPPHKTPPDAVCVRQVWSYYQKRSGEYKARDCLNGKQLTRQGTLYKNTYAICVNWMPVALMFFATSALKNMIIEAHDVVNAHMESEAPCDNLYTVVDPPMSEYFREVHNKHVPVGWRIPILTALQGHPEAGRMFDECVQRRFIDPLDAKPSKVEPSIMTLVAPQDKSEALVLRQVDDFAVASASALHRRRLHCHLDDQFRKVKHPGLMKEFMGCNVEQTRYYIHIHAEDYINQVLAGHNLSTPAANEKTPPKEPIHPQAVKQIFSEAGSSDDDSCAHLEEKYGFAYRTVIGELIFLIQLCRFDATTAVTLLSCFSHAPAGIHFAVLKRLLLYLRGTKRRGLIFWRQEPCLELPVGPIPPEARHDPDLPYPDDPDLVAWYFDASFANFLLDRKSLMGYAGCLGGTAIYAKCKKQPTVSTSACESEFLCSVTCAKVALYTRQVAIDIKVPQRTASPLYGDNEGTERLANHRKPSGRTRHLDIKLYAIQEWVQQGKIILHRVCSALNPSDALTKIVGHVLHHRHCDELMGANGPRFLRRD